MKAIKQTSKRNKIIIFAVAGVVLICVCVVFAALVSDSPESTSVAESPNEVEDKSSSVDIEEPTAESMDEVTSIVIPTTTSSPAPTETNTPKPTDTNTPEPSPTPIQGLLKIGTYMVGKDVQPGIYWGQAGFTIFDSCYWARLTDLTGGVDSLIANDNAIGQYYVEIKETDFAFETACELIHLDFAPIIEYSDELPPGTYFIGRDIRPGTYQGQAGEDILDSCYWARLNNVSGGINSIIANDNAIGSYYVQVLGSDFAFKTACPLTWISE